MADAGRPTAATLKQVKAWLPCQRAMRLLNAGQRERIAHCPLLNWTVHRWS
jgi:hypothetical protein